MGRCEGAGVRVWLLRAEVNGGDIGKSEKAQG
jgi:hypothetical protein